MINGQDLITNVATNIVEDSIRLAWNKISKFFLDLDAKESIRYKTAYEKYLTNTRRKNSKIKTIIYRRVPKDIYSFYECIGVSYNGKSIDTRRISNLFHLGNKVIVTGTGGVGKSMLFKHLFLNTIEETTCIPVLLELRGFNIIDTKEVSLYESIYKALCDNGFELNKDHFEYSMKEGAYIIFLDGYDELNRDKTGKITSEIKSLTEKYGNNKFFLSSRPSDAFIGWHDFCEVQTQKLTKEQALSLIKKIEFDKAVKETFYKELNEHLYARYESFASNPLLLNIMLLTFQKHASIPERLNDFYEEAFVTLFNVHDATKDSYVRDIRCGLGCEDFKYVFAYICFKSYFNDEYEFSEARLRNYLEQAKIKLGRINFCVEDFQDDLTLSVCMLVKEGLSYRFSHRSFQEYFAAWYTCKLVDETQSKLLLSWIKESDSVLTDAYLEMLFDLQSEKVNKIILCPILKDVKKLYLQHGFSIGFLENLFSGIKIIKRLSEDKEPEYALSLTIKNRYLCRGLILNNRLNRFQFEKGNPETEKILYDKIKKYNTSKKGINDRNKVIIDFDDLLEVISEEEFLQVIKWFHTQVLFAMQIIDQCEEGNISKKKKVATILEEL